jgi:hypothetical protein
MRTSHKVSLFLMPGTGVDPINMVYYNIVWYVMNSMLVVVSDSHKVR